MDENRPLDLFLQPSRRLIFISLIFILCCVILLATIPALWWHKLLLVLVMAVGIISELVTRVLMLSARSIIRVGFDGGVMASDGNMSARCWWYQRRRGTKTYAELSPDSLVWKEWVVLDCGRWPFGQAVVIARDSVELEVDFQRLKRILRSGD